MGPERGKPGREAVTATHRVFAGRDAPGAPRLEHAVRKENEVRKIPEIDKLKDRIYDLPEADAERLLDWLTSMTEVRREDRKRKEIRKAENNK